MARQSLIYVGALVHGLPATAIADSAQFPIGAQPMSAELKVFAEQLTQAGPGVSAQDPLAGHGPSRGETRNQSGQLEELVVTASKREQRLQDVPTSVTAETGAELERRGATQLQDIVMNVPGLSNPGSGQGNNTNLTIRGVTTGTDLGLKQSTVALLIDDIPLDPSARGGGTTNVRTVDIERVEVLRGPQGTLFGSGSLSGAVRFITNKPDLEQLTGSAELTTAAIDSGSTSYSGNVILNVPIIQDRLAARLVGYGFHDAGWIDYLATGEQDANHVNTHGGRAQLGLALDEAFRANLMLLYQNSVDHNAQGSLYDKPANTGRPGQVDDGATLLDSRITNEVASLNLQYDLDSVSIISTTSYQKRESEGTGHAGALVPSMSYLAWVLSGGDINDDSHIVYGRSDDSFGGTENNVTEELRLSSTGSGSLQYTLGLFYLDSDFSDFQLNQSDLLTPVTGGPLIVDLRDSGTRRELAVFGDATYTFLDQLDFSVGARWSDIKLTANVLTRGFLPLFDAIAPYRHVDFASNDTAFDPRVTITYRANPDLTVYAQAAQGFRAGGLNGTFGVRSTTIPQTYSPDKLRNYEVGAKGKLFGGMARYGVALYDIHWSDIQIGLSTDLGYNYTANAGKAELYGMELQFDTKPIDWLEFGAAVSLGRNRMAEDNPYIVRPSGAVGVSDGDLLPASPERQGSAYAQYNFKLGGHAAYLRSNLSYLGPQWTDFARDGAKFGDFTIVNVRAGIQLGYMEVVGFINNVTNDQGGTGAADEAIVGPIVAQAQKLYRVQPRTFGLAIRTAF